MGRGGAGRGGSVGRGGGGIGLWRVKRTGTHDWMLNIASRMNNVRKRGRHAG